MKLSCFFDRLFKFSRSSNNVRKFEPSNPDFGGKVMNLYSVYDKVSKVFQFPCAVENDEAAIRGFSGLAGSYKFFPDLELYCVGTFNLETGVISPVELPSLVCSGSQFPVVKDGDSDEV